MNKQTILCVDDERNVLLALRTQLLRHFPDCKVEIAESADEAFELVEDLLSEGVEIPLVISDQIMPGMKGDRFLIELHHRYPQILQVMLTGQASAEDVGNVVNQGNLYRFLAKPWNEIDLSLTVTEALRRYQQEQQLAQQQVALERANRELEALNADLEQQVQERTQQLRRNQQQLQLFVEYSPVAVAMFDCQMNYQVASQRWISDYNLGEQPIIGKCHYDVFPGVPDYWKKIHQRGLNGFVERNEQDTYIRPDGKQEWVRWEVRPWYDTEDSIGGIIIFGEVITDRILVAEALRESERRYRLLSEVSPVGIFHNDLSGSCIYANAKTLQITGLSLEENLGNNWGKNLHPDDRSWMYAAWTNFVEQINLGHDAEYCIEHRYLYPDGSIKWGFVQAVPERNINGDLVGFVGSVVDITDRKQEDLALQSLVEGTASVTGKEFFSELVKQIAIALDVSYVYLDRQVGENLETLAWYAEDRLQPNLVYKIAHTPCELVLREGVYACSGVKQLFPLNQNLVGRDVDSYLGVALQNAAGEKIGVLCVLNHQPLFNPKRAELLLRIFGARVTVELERSQTLDDLESLNQNLEERVNKRTQELAGSKLILQESEERFRQLAENIDQVFWLAPADQSRTMYVSPAFERIWGYTCEELYRTPMLWLEAIHPQDRDRIMISLEKTAENGHDREYRIIRRDGEIRWIHDRAFPIRDRSSQVYRIAGIAEDISDRKRTEQQLQSERLRLQLALEAAEMGTWESNLDTGIWSERTEAIFGYAPGTFPGDREAFLKLVYVEDQERVFQALSHSFATQSPYNVEYRINHLKGEIRWVAVRGKVVENEEGNGLRMVGVALDITERKQAEEALRQSEMKYRRIFDNSQVGIFRSRIEDGLVLAANQYFVELTGYQSINEVVGKKKTADFYSIDLRQQVLEHLRQFGQLNNFEFEFQQHGGKQCWGLVSLSLNLEEQCIDGVINDISDRKQVEIALQESQQFIQSIAENTPNIIYIYDLSEQRNIYCNREVFSILGYTIDEIKAMGKNVLPSLVHPDDWTKVLEYQQTIAAAQDKQIIEQEYRMLHVDGSWRYLLDRTSVFKRDAEGRVLQYIGAAQDVSDRKLAEAELRDSEERLRLALTAANQGLYDLNPQTGIAIVSPEYATMLGYDPLEFQETNTKWIERLHPDDIERVAATYQAYVCGEISDYKVEFRQRTKHGDWKWILSIGKVVAWDETGQPLRMLGTHTDISDRKRAEAALRKSEALLRRVFESNVAGMVFSNFDGYIVDANDRFLQMLGYSREDLQSGLPPWNEITPPEHVAADMHAIEELTRTGEIKPWEKEYFRKDGSRVPVLIGAAFIEGSDPQTIAVVVDISDRKRAEEALRQANIDLEVRVEERTAELKQAKEAAEMANRAKSEFLANVSHELRTPLNGILGYTQILQNSTTLTDRDREGLGIIYRCGTHLLTLIGDILDLAKIEAKKLELQIAEQYLAPFLQDLIDICHISAGQKNIDFIYESSFPLPREIYVDAKRLRQVLLNLLGNAIKFTDLGSVTFRVDVLGQEQQLLASGAEGWTEFTIRFTIADTGIGISSEQLERILLPFEQVGDTTRQSEGTGLGLAITHSLLTMMGSTLEIQSQLGQGSVFGFTLQVRAAATAIEEPRTTPPPQIIGFKGQPRKILIVDDKPDNRLIFLDLLQPLGFEMQEAENGRSGIERAVSWQPDLIVVDLSMPSMDGWELIRRLRQLPQGESFAIVLSSARAFESDRQKSLEMGANAFLEKPFHAEKLLEILQTHLNLEWSYAPIDRQIIQKNASDPEVTSVTIVPPSPEILDRLMDLALKGTLNKLIDTATQLETSDPSLVPFASKLRSLVERFQIKELRKFIRSYREESI
ncbi:hypothetical protein TUMEXPCC7403_06135 [Tumidithrix helvetica PCC 7403]|uniref:PAS domain S-box protein n=1 Tax=Tumidithrix helvetica TaxID=3457545 RepID=UPI003CB9AF9C